MRRSPTPAIVGVVVVVLACVSLVGSGWLADGIKDWILGDAPAGHLGSWVMAGLGLAFGLPTTALLLVTLQTVPECDQGWKNYTALWRRTFRRAMHGTTLIPAVIGAYLIAVAGGWLADGFNEWVPIIWVMGLVVTVVGVALLYFFGRRALPIQVLEEDTRLVPSKVLITPLSVLNLGDVVDRKDLSSDQSQGAGQARRILDELSAAQSLEELRHICCALIEQYPKLAKANFLPVLLALLYHKDKLQEWVILPPKPEKVPDNAYHSSLVRLLEEVAERSGIKVEIRDAVDSGDYQALYQALEEARTALTEQGALRYGNEDLVIDVTGGQKIASIAGLSATLNNQMRIQYVITGAVTAAIRNHEDPGALDKALLIMGLKYEASQG